MKVFVPLFLLTLWKVNFSFCQVVDCSNIGFELGTSAGWVLVNGTVSDANQKIQYGSEAQGTFENGHLITKLSDGNDPKITAEAIPMVAPGSNYSIRIGNITRGTRYDRIRTSFVVTEDNTLFQYKFAVILQNASTNHAEYQKPGFSIAITDEEGKDLACSYYDVQVSASGTVADFKTQGDLQYRNWTTGAMDLRNYIGKTITVEVTAHGCTRQGHFGYAYFDAQCIKSEIKQVSKCPDSDGYLTFLAPSGFEKYLWNTGSTASSIKVKALPGDRFSVKMLPLASLASSCELQMEYTVSYQKTDTTLRAVLCEGESYTLADTTYQTAGTHVRKVISGTVCDSTVTLLLTVNPVIHYTQQKIICKGDSLMVGDSCYKQAGVYTTRVSRSPLCDSIVTTTLTVDSLFAVLPSEVTLTEGDSVQLQAEIISSAIPRFLWQPDLGLSCSTCPSTWASPVQNQSYILRIENENLSCLVTDTVRVTVRSCGIYAPNVFTPNGDGINDLFFVYGNSCVSIIQELVIYDRWGEILFRKTNFPASDPAFGWDGNYRNKSAANGVYPYKAKVALKNGRVKSYEGALTLVR